MNKAIRLAGIVGAGVLAIAIAAFAAATFVVDSDWVKQRLIEKLETASGRTWSAATLQLQLRSDLRIHATQLIVSNPDWALADSPDFLRAQSAQVDVALLPLLAGRMHLKDVQLDGVQLFLARKGALDNWHFAKTNTTPPSAGTGSKSSRGLSLLPDRLVLRGATVRAALQLDHPQALPRHWLLPLLRMRASGARNIELEAQLPEVQPNVQPNAQTSVQPASGSSSASGLLQARSPDRLINLQAHAADLSGFGVKDAHTSFSLHTDVSGASDAGSIDIQGEVPLAPENSLAGTDLRVHVDLPAGSPLLVFLGALRETAPAATSSGLPLAAIKLDATLQERSGAIDIGQLAFVLGGLRITGQATVRLPSQGLQAQQPPALPWHIAARLQTDHLDWAQAMLDAGRPPVPPKEQGDLFRDLPLAWPLLRKIKDFTADVDLQLGLLKLRNGLPLQNVKATLQLAPDSMRVPAFSAQFLGGTANATALFVAHNERVTLNLNANNVSIEQWRQVLHRKKVLSGGPLTVRARVVAAGASMQELAAHLNGTVDLRMGHAIVESQRAGEAETVLTGLVPALAGKAAERMEVVCAVASLPFKDGRAAARSIAGARTASSQLLTDGEVDLRTQTLDLHGHVKGVDGIRLGASMFVGDVNISGKLGKPHFRLDAQGMLGTAARIGAAIFTGGLSVVGTTLWDATADDACKQPPAVADRRISGERASPP